MQCWSSCSRPCRPSSRGGGGRRCQEEPVAVVAQAVTGSVPEVVMALLPAVRCAVGGGGNVDGLAEELGREPAERERVRPG
jgi:hypothetical protein